MGITELWKLVSPSTEGQTLTAFALEGLKGHVQDEGGLSMMTIGVDARPSDLDMPSRAKTQNYAHSSNAPVHAHFIFDGEDCPPIKRSKHVRSAPHWLTRSLQELLQIFGFTWTTAKGEAEADLAYLSKAGKISAVLTEDSDALLFGVAKVLRLTDNDDSTFLVDAYCAEALSNDPKIPLTTSHLLLWAMLHGGDYNPGGLLGCGSQLPGMLKTWRDHLPTVLVDGTLGEITTWSDGASSTLLPQLNPTQPNIGRLAAFCKARLGWMRPKIHKYLRNHFWSAACMRALCQLRTNDGDTLPKPTFNVNKRKDPEGGVSVYCVTLYAPSFIHATDDGIQADDDPNPEEGKSWVPSHSKVTIPARIMELTSPQDVIDYSDQHAASAGPSSGDPLPDWHPCLSAQYAAVADMLWPEAGDTSSEVGDPELSGGSRLKYITSVMGRTKKTSNKVLVHPSEASPKKRRKGAQPTGNTTLPAIDKIKERAKQQHKHANSTRKNYGSYVDRGQKWLKVHASATGCGDEESHNDDAYEDATFRDALEQIPNQHSDKALALFISYKYFHENNGQSTCDGIYAAFKKAGDTYCGKWNFNETQRHWEGNPACLAEVQDVIKSVRHKTNSEGADRTHSIAMSKGFMDRILTRLLEGDTMATDNLTLELRTSITHTVMYQAFSTTTWNLWTRCFELIKLKKKDLTIDPSEVNTAFRKYLYNETLSVKDSHARFERKVDKGLKEADLRSNRYKIYPQPDMPGCDCFFWMLLWLALLKRIHYNGELGPEDFVFPTIGSNGIIHRGEHISHDAVQAWINEATTGAGIPRGGGDSFTTHTYCRGGAQWRWMFAPVGERWTLARVRWWGSWAENENRDTLIWYLLDELSTYENDHSDALCPTQNEADGSLLGEHRLVRPACSQDLQLMQRFITADVEDLRSDVRFLTNTLISSRNGPPGSTLVHEPPVQHALYGTFLPRESPTLIPQQMIPAPSHTFNPVTNGTSTTNVGSCPLPEKGLDIPNLPVRHADGSYAPKKDSWGRLKGKNKAIFGSKYHQRALIALEFLEQYQGNESAFLAAYPEYKEGHTALLTAVKRTKKDRGEIIPRK
ncbi:uncharacterized protein HD556DRAFT_1311616 [Suillus plorans]|uniref:XPG-I domain-containing protein n=1 Tax=Suillus plorans TaxID=116603 RepID=A0A9P7DE30_9AGAM|nr:uncharacterized protein HD556DRAFT_1311616 [Suillus plorans]KAG1789049.1 hypothetical protein HD556DRAFT_1311616 [Suillus plorans]